MRRDFLRSLGIEDKETIDKILDENSSDIGRAKGELETVKSDLSKAQSDLAKKIAEYDTLKESTKDYSSLSEKITQLEADKAQLSADNAQMKVDLNAKVTSILKDHAIENSVRDAKAKNTKAVIALLDKEKIEYKDNQLTGISEQLESLKTGEDTAFLFGDVPQAVPSGTSPNNPPLAGSGSPKALSFGDAVRNALNTNK